MDNPLDLPPFFKLFLQNVQSLVQIKLDDSNYQVWRAQVIATLKAYRLYSHVTGPVKKPPPPPPTAALNSAAETYYTKWLLINEHLRACLFCVITPYVLQQVLHLDTTPEIWQALENRFYSQSRPHINQLRLQLFNIKKGVKSMQQYLDEVKQLCDCLSGAGEPMRNDDLVFYILQGLGPEYEALCSSIRVKTDAILISDLSSLLLSEELRLKLLKDVHITSATDIHTALVTHASPSSSGGPRGGFAHRGGRFSTNSFHRGGRGGYRGHARQVFAGRYSLPSPSSSQVQSSTQPVCC